MKLTPEIGIAIICAFVVYPFAVGAVVLHLARINKRIVGLAIGGISAGVAGLGLSILLSSMHASSKNPQVGILFCFVFSMSSGATGALLGGVCDRLFHFSPSRERQLLR